MEDFFGICGRRIILSWICLRHFLVIRWLPDTSPSFLILLSKRVDYVFFVVHEEYVYVGMVITYYILPGKVANPARGQLNKES